MSSATHHPVLRLRGGAGDNEEAPCTIMDRQLADTISENLTSVLIFTKDAIIHLRKVYWEGECKGVLLPNQDEMTDKQAFHSLTTVNGAVHFMEDFRQEKICQGIHMRDQRFLDVLTDIQSLVAIFEPHLEVCKFRASYASQGSMISVAR
jgi:hypothetical protein